MYRFDNINNIVRYLFNIKDKILRLNQYNITFQIVEVLVRRLLWSIKNLNPCNCGNQTIRHQCVIVLVLE